MPTIHINTPNNVTISQVNVATQRASLEAEYKALVAGITTELSDVTSVTLRGVVYTKDALIAKFQGRIDASEKTKTARTALHALVAIEQGVDQAVAPLRMDFKQFLNSRYGKNSPELQKFGYLQAKKPQRTVVAKATAVSSNQATRVARGTKGKKQKSKITGKSQAAAAPPATGTAPFTMAPPPQPPTPPPTAVNGGPPPAPPAKPSTPGATS